MNKIKLENRLLDSLPRQERELLQSRLEAVSMETRETLNEVGSRLGYLHFPTAGAISLMEIQSSGRTVEVAVIGREGCSGFYVPDGVKTAPCLTIVQIGGAALRLKVSDLRVLLPHTPVFARNMRRFSAVVFRHVVLSVGCSQFHSVEQRLGRWLLAHRHQTGLNIFPFTHDFLAEQLGAQRVTVTQTLSHFEDRHLVTYGYGKIELLNVRRMRQTACECFRSAVRATDAYLKEIKNRTF